MDALSIPDPDRRRQRWFLFALCLFFVAINVQYVIKTSDSEHLYRSAFRRWSVQLVKLGTGVDIWATHNYPNPPIMALILKPLAHLPLLAGSLAWFYLKVGMAILAVAWIIKLLDRPDHPFPWWGKALTVLLCLRPIEGDLIHGNVNLFILFLVAAALYSFCRQRDLLAGLLLGLAIACKVTPALFIPYFLWKRAWKTLAGTALGLGLFVWVVPSLFLGWQENQQYLQSWYRNMVQPFADGKVTSEHVNQSLPGFLARTLTHNPSFAIYVNDTFTPTEYHNVLDLGAGTVQWIVKGCMGLFALLVIWRCRTPTQDRRSWRLLAEFGVVIVGMLLFSERTWKHHCVVLLIPFAVLAYCLSAQRWPVRWRWSIGAMITVASLLMLLTSTGLSSRLDRVGELAQVYGAYLWAHLVLLVGMLTVLGRQPDQECAAASGTPPVATAAQDRAA